MASQETRIADTNKTENKHHRVRNIAIFSGAVIGGLIGGGLIVEGSRQTSIDQAARTLLAGQQTATAVADVSPNDGANLNSFAQRSLARSNDIGTPTETPTATPVPSKNDDPRLAILNADKRTDDTNQISWPLYSSDGFDVQNDLYKQALTCINPESIGTFDSDPTKNECMRLLQSEVQNPLTATDIIDHRLTMKVKDLVKAGKNGEWSFHVVGPDLRLNAELMALVQIAETKDQSLLNLTVSAALRNATVQQQVVAAADTMMSKKVNFIAGRDDNKKLPASFEALPDALEIYTGPNMFTTCEEHAQPIPGADPAGKRIDTQTIVRSLVTHDGKTAETPDHAFIETEGYSGVIVRKLNPKTGKLETGFLFGTDRKYFEAVSGLDDRVQRMMVSAQIFELCGLEAGPVPTDTQTPFITIRHTPVPTVVITPHVEVTPTPTKEQPPTPVVPNKPAPTATPGVGKQTLVPATPAPEVTQKQSTVVPPTAQPTPTPFR